MSGPVETESGFENLPEPRVKSNVDKVPLGSNLVGSPLGVRRTRLGLCNRTSDNALPDWLVVVELLFEVE